jgi:glutamine amidotransferase
LLKPTGTRENRIPKCPSRFSHSYRLFSTSHPFQFGRFMFMHNGGVANFSKIKRQLLARLSLKAYSVIQGTTDSEHAGALFIDCLPGQNMHGDYSVELIKEALRQTIAVEDAEKAAGTSSRVYSHDQNHHVASSLNFAVTDGKVVVATRFRDHPEEHPPSLYICKATGTPILVI